MNGLRVSPVGTTPAAAACRRRSSRRRRSPSLNRILLGPSLQAPKQNQLQPHKHTHSRPPTGPLSVDDRSSARTITTQKTDSFSLLRVNTQHPSRPARAPADSGRLTARAWAAKPPVRKDGAFGRRRKGREQQHKAEREEGGGSLRFARASPVLASSVHRAT